MNDFDYTIDLFQKLFKKKSIQDTLNNNHSGWEKWLQIKFADYLKLLETNNEIEYRRELKISVDQRITNDCSNYSADFAIRRKGYAKDKYILIELKQKESYKSCLSLMLKDAKKHYCIKPSELERVRDFILVGVHTKASKTDIKTHLINLIEFENKITIGEIESYFIPKTDFAFTAFNVS